MSLANYRDFHVIGDERGSLVVLDKSTGIPFEIERVYYLFGMSDAESRGFHAHKKLHQIAFCISGTCTMILDDGMKREQHHLDSPNIGIDLPPMLWHEMSHFSEDCVLLVLASDEYKETDYIRDYHEFRRLSLI